ncbi:MAG: tRNA preQ1(34) S-adenosylmethionine ribosyltransferase-isomerase QueA [Chlamydiae bacterium]|nr:tRNA preQ1(34) S-adenosylmethionine ribosyltransferase-isomerase QueA [Chlamydiota bacterium]MBI3267146.1 tRNA preQ1(34) S-adenosylmethionine ribosyltransferase-isomerase QueA [Chlamydiota bacterium]
MNEYDYYLPKNLIAQTPSSERSASRLLIYSKDERKIEHRAFYEIEEIFQKGDCVVVNDSKVISARLWGQKTKTGKAVEFLWLEEIKSGIWCGLLRGKNKLGGEFDFGARQIKGRLLSKNEDGTTTLEVTPPVSALSFLSEHGVMPLPPYIAREKDKKNLKDQDRYQTVYAKFLGSVAAPTAGLHFDAPLIEKLKGKGVEFISVTLHVGLGTFQPLKADCLEKGELHSENFEILEENARKINQALQEKRRLIVIGTTTARVLESAATEDGSALRAGKGVTKLFIRPPYRFKMIKNLLTNFHLPKSSLFMLVAALIGREKVLEIYQKAIEEKYRFYSYGDAMLILNNKF